MQMNELSMKEGLRLRRAAWQDEHESKNKILRWEHKTKEVLKNQFVFKKVYRNKKSKHPFRHSLFIYSAASRNVRFD